MSNNAKQANYVTKKTGICIKNKRRNINLRYCYNEDLPRRSSFTNYLQNLRNDNKQKRNRTKNNKDGNILLERFTDSARTILVVRLVPSCAGRLMTARGNAAPRFLVWLKLFQSCMLRISPTLQTVSSHFSASSKAVCILDVQSPIHLSSGEAQHVIRLFSYSSIVRVTNRLTELLII